MTDPVVIPEDGIQLLRTYLLHCRYVQAEMRKIVQQLETRLEVHDTSKLRDDEFAGFSRINKAAREHPYGSLEYRAGLKQEKPTIDLHYSRNSHHPEHHDEPKAMQWLDIIEMVCDWRGAYLAYGSQGSWHDNLERQRERYLDRGWFTDEQWWLIKQVAVSLE